MNAFMQKKIFLNLDYDCSDLNCVSPKDVQFLMPSTCGVHVC